MQEQQRKNITGFIRRLTVQVSLYGMASLFAFLHMLKDFPLELVVLFLSMAFAYQAYYWLQKSKEGDGDARRIRSIKKLITSASYLIATVGTVISYRINSTIYPYTMNAVIIGLSTIVRGCYYPRLEICGHFRGLLYFLHVILNIFFLNVAMQIDGFVD